MSHGADDKELVRNYVADGSDAAFRALVTRHVDLVYGAAFRQVGDTGLAEEITQNVFVALARKAPRLAGRETLAGWLYRTTLLEAKARIRAELRRRRREETAVELAAIEHEGASSLAEMAPLLDEGLLNLREQDRLALVLRFLEDRSLREVGETLGIDEDAARKRVSRALERLAGFFRKQGFAASASVTSATLLEGASRAAPAAVSAAATKAGLASGATTSSLNLFIAKLMGFTKTQTAGVCILLAAIPLALQYHAEARVSAAQAAINAQLRSNQSNAQDLERQTQRDQEMLFGVQSESQTADAQLALVTSQLQGKSPRPAYHWNDKASLVRVSKTAIEQLPLNAVSNHRGQLSEQIKEVLQMSGAEVRTVQESLDRFVTGFNNVQAATLREVEPSPTELQGHEPQDTRVFAIRALGDQLEPLREELFREVEATLGEQRFGLFRKALRDWMPVEDEQGGMNSGMAVFDFDHRVVFYKPTPGQAWMDWQIRKLNGEMMSFGIEIDDMPQALRPRVQDWIAIAKSQPASQAPPK